MTLVEVQVGQIWSNDQDGEVLITEVLEPRDSREPRGIDVTFTVTGNTRIYDEPDFRREFSYLSYLRWQEVD